MRASSQSRTEYFHAETITSEGEVREESFYRRLPGGGMKKVAEAAAARPKAADRTHVALPKSAPKE